MAEVKSEYKEAILQAVLYGRSSLVVGNCSMELKVISSWMAKYKNLCSICAILPFYNAYTRTFYNMDQAITGLEFMINKCLNDEEMTIEEFYPD